MYLKSLTMKGFKSFADPTTIEFEPGVTVVVGPNGSGKSNVVDAVAWVLGAQGPSVVRSAKMDDVIFAGTTQRAALGRAEVTLVIDNSSRRLALDLNEVTIQRTLFRSGDSEYALNGVECRLLDVQELLSDSGVGRQQHSLIGQGQLDSVLQSRPEDRRMVIEEAAGVLKFRRRRERAVRRLQAAEESLVRLGDLLREVRRQLRPLERQAASADRHQSLSAELRELSLYLAGRELGDLQRVIADAERREAAEKIETDKLVAHEAELAVTVSAAEEELGEDPADAVIATIARLERLDERARGLGALMTERRRTATQLIAALDEAAGVGDLGEMSRRLSDELAALDDSARRAQSELDELANDEALFAESEASFHEQFPVLEATAAQAAALARAALTDRRDSLEAAENHATWADERHASLANRREAVVAERDSSAARRETSAQAKAAAEAAQLAAAAEVETAREDLRVAEEVLAQLREERQGLLGKEEALALALDEIRARAGVERLDGVAGVLGPLVELIEVDEGASLAFEAAVGEALDGIVVAGADDARAALDRLRGLHAGGQVLFAPASSLPAGAGGQPPPDGGEWLRDRVRAADRMVGRVLDELLADVVLATGSFADALALALRFPRSLVVSTEGDRFSPRGWRIGSARSGATLAALEAARAALLLLDARVQAATAQRDDAAARRKLTEPALLAAEQQLERLRADELVAAQSIAEASALLDLISSELDSARDEAVAARERADEIAAALLFLEDQLVTAEIAAERERREVDAAQAARAVLDERAGVLAARRRELEVQVRSLEERRVFLVARSEETEREIAERDMAQGEALARRATLRANDDALQSLERELAEVRGGVTTTRRTLEVERDRRQQHADARLQRLGALRREREQVDRQLRTAAERRQRIEIEIAEARVRHEAFLDSLRRELDVTPEEAIAAPRPPLPEGASAVVHRSALERELRDLGPVNLLAREELTGLIERSEFLETQIEDARNARRELNGVIRAIDAEIVTVFSEAFADVAENFERLIVTLFPGGSGRLSLTAPDDLLETGIEIEARPAGRTVRRLSLLSGGERSLVAMAFLFAVFRSRPSPFYLMDEVEAALDDANLGRFLSLVEEFRDEAQLVIVSHQQRTMEIADALYGISIQPGGASKVLSERPGARRAAPGPDAPRAADPTLFEDRSPAHVN